MLATIYFDHSIGLAGANLHKFDSVVHLTDKGRRLLILAGDYNMEPHEWDHQLLKAAGLQIMTAGSTPTCKIRGGSK